MEKLENLTVPSNLMPVFTMLNPRRSETQCTRFISFLVNTY